ncbi:MAG: GDP-mannose 4,6-dehydratase [Patescibacteria group bacterium]
MTELSKKILVTGGLGFIGSHFITLLLKRGYGVVNIDKVTYAVRKDLNFERHENYEFIKADISELKALPIGISHVVNFAAESHVDNSIRMNYAFLKSNSEGVYNLLELIRVLPPKERPTFIQISTDEVYGDILEGSFSETDRLNPSNPYSASKASADMFVHAWTRTYGIRTRICRSSNNYGYGQNAEKLVPRTMKMAYKGIKMTVHGNGSYVREWTYVGDNCEAIFLVMTKGKDGEIYNISSGESLTNLEVVKKVLKIMGRADDFYELVPNRPGQDVRYSVTSEKIRALGWSPTTTLEQHLPICEELNEIRRNHQPLGKKKTIMKYLKMVPRAFWFR